MTDTPSNLSPGQPVPPSFPPMHPVTRLGRIVQQLRSFAELHATELETMASALDSSGAAELAAQLRTYRDVQRDEAAMVVDELVDIQTDMANAVAPPAPPQERQPLAPAAAASASSRDPAINSPKRAKWLAEQAAEAERLKAPMSRRDLFGRVAARADEDED